MEQGSATDDLVNALDWRVSDKAIWLRLMAVDTSRIY
jgi:hypothetical protein